MLMHDHDNNSLLFLDFNIPCYTGSSRCLWPDISGF